MQKLTYHQFKDDKLIAVDIETKDPDLIKKGPSVYRGGGYIVGVSFANADISEYYPLRHPDTDDDTRVKNLKYIEEQLSSDNRKVFANGMYDLDWLENWEKIPVKGTIDDVQWAEPLLDEYRSSYSLNSLAEKYLEREKIPDGIAEYCVQQGWIKQGAKGAINHLWRVPYNVVRPYAEMDTRLTYDVFVKQLPILEQQNLTDLYSLETSLYPLLLNMRRVGVRLDSSNLMDTGMKLSDIAYDMGQELEKILGREVNVNSKHDMTDLFNAVKIPIRYHPPTEKMMMDGETRGNPRFDKETLGRIDHPVCKQVLELRHITTLLNMFIHPYTEQIVDNRLHGQFHPLRNDDYGTVSGRFSSSNPNLQQVSGRNEEEHVHGGSEILSGQVIRKLFLPEEGCDWLKVDWNQIEYRLIAHYAQGEGADTIRKRYRDNPETDYHAELMEMTGIESRKTIKTLNFGAAYGMGVATMAKKYGWNEREANAVYKMYHSKVPFVKETSKRVSLRAKKLGYIRTILDRRARLSNPNKAYVMFNRLIQGGAADLMKKAMSDAWKEGVFNVLIPHITVHDELDCSVPKTKEGKEAVQHLKYVMENCVELRVPVIADCEMGPNWGELEAI